MFARQLWNELEDARGDRSHSEFAADLQAEAADLVQETVAETLAAVQEFATQRYIDFVEYVERVTDFCISVRNEGRDIVQHSEWSLRDNALRIRRSMGFQ